MISLHIHKPTAWGVSASFCLTLVTAFCFSGCGGAGTESGDAVVVPEPNTNVASKARGTASPSTSGGATEAPSTSAAAPTATPTAAVKADGWGTLKGQIKFGGDAAAFAPKVLQEQGKAAKDPDMCAVGGPIKSERLLIDDATKGVKNVLVYIPKPTAVNEEAKKAFESSTVEFDQKGCVFHPHVLGIMAGQQVTLKSSDPKNHNVNIKLKASGFNQTVGGGQSFPFKASGPERTPGQVVCDIHPWMISWWMVLDNPYIAVTDAKGNFEIKNAPAGTQKVVVWQEAVGFITPQSGQEVTLKAGEPTTLDLSIDSAKVRPES
jgi:plastocyanin